MTGNAAYAILNAKINSKHLGPTYTQAEVDAKVKALNDKIDAIPEQKYDDGNEVKY